MPGVSSGWDGQIVLDSGTLSVPFTPAIFDYAEALQVSYAGGVETLFGANPEIAARRPSCVRQIVQLAGGSWICYLGIVGSAASAGTASGVAIGACLGSKGMLVIDLLWEHLAAEDTDED